MDTEALESRNPLAPGRGDRGTKRDPDRQPFTRTSTEEIIHILTLAQRDVSQSEIARITGLSVQTVSDVCRRYAHTTVTAMTVLKANSHKAAEDWVGSFEKARKRGDHRPMKDLLIATGVVAPDPAAQGVQIFLGFPGQISTVPSELQLPPVDVVDAECRPADNDGKS